MGWIRAAATVAGVGSLLIAVGCQGEPPERDYTRAVDYTERLGCAPSTQRLIDAAGPLEPIPTGPDVDPEPVAARPTLAFVESIGVNIHMTYTNTPYIDHDRVLETLQETGIRHVRDALVPGREVEQSTFLARLAEQDGCAQLILGGDTVDDDGLAQSLQLVRQQADVVSGVEGPNEMDGSKIDDWPDAASDQQRLIASGLRGQPELEQTPVAALSVSRLAAYGKAGDQSETSDLANIHPYPGGDPPEGELEPHIQAARKIAGDAPVIVTETGYHNALGDEEAHPGISEEAEAVYLPRLLLDAFARGVVRTYLYELVDEFPDGDGDDEASFGLYRNDWSPKPAADSVATLVSLLSSTSSSSSKAGSLEVAVRAADDADVRSLLLADDEGYWLALWQPTSVYDYDDQEDIDVREEAVTVMLGGAADVTIHDLIGDGPARAVADVEEIEVDVSAEPRLVRVEPR